MFDTSDIELTRLPEGGDGHIRAFDCVWHKALERCCEGGMSLYPVLVAGRLGCRHNVTGMCDYQPQASNHFQMPVHQVIGARFACAPMHAV